MGVNQNVVIADTIPPVTPILADVTGQCSATATVPTTTDNCAGTVIGTTTDPLTYTTQGTHVIHWTFNEIGGERIREREKISMAATSLQKNTILADVTGKCS